MTSIGSSTNAVECPYCLELLTLDTSDPAVNPNTKIDSETKKFHSCIDTCSESCQQTSHKCAHVFHKDCLEKMNNSEKNADSELLKCEFCKIRITKEYTVLNSEQLADFEKEETQKNMESDEAFARAKSVEDQRIKNEKLAEEKKNLQAKKNVIAKVAAISMAIIVIIGAIILAVILV